MYCLVYSEEKEEEKAENSREEKERRAAKPKKQQRQRSTSPASGNNSSKRPQSPQHPRSEPRSGSESRPPPIATFDEEAVELTRIRQENAQIQFMLQHQILQAKIQKERIKSEQIRTATEELNEIEAQQEAFATHLPYPNMNYTSPPRSRTIHSSSSSSSRVHSPASYAHASAGVPGGGVYRSPGRGGQTQFYSPRGGVEIMGGLPHPNFSEESKESEEYFYKRSPLSALPVLRDISHGRTAYYTAKGTGSRRAQSKEQYFMGSPPQTQQFRGGRGSPSHAAVGGYSLRRGMPGPLNFDHY